ncbi:MAG: branched-chain amino acid ABC transporter permease [Rhodospirillaceae bacterium]|nr:branched-chain amino acid ABC transporter permease [Rhodospirillaceae bacterium]
MSDYLLQQLANGLILGSMYALVAIGFSMIYGIVRLINFAHGDIAMIGAFTALAALMAADLPIIVVVLAVLLVGAAVGLAIEAVAFRPLRGAPQVNGFITSLAVSVLIQNTGILVLTAEPRSVAFPAFLSQPIAGLPITVDLVDVLIVVLAIVLMAALGAIVNRTRLGMAMRATAENLDVARLMGINVNRAIMAAFAIGSALAGMAGLMWGARYGQIDPMMGFLPGLKAFVAAVIGGVGSIPGAMLGGYLLGLAEVLFVGLLPPEYAGFRDAFVFGTLILVLLVLPNGLLGRAAEDRA